MDHGNFVRPPDVPAYVERTATYAAGASTPNIVGDGVGTRGSPMPVLASQLDDIPSDDAALWIKTGGGITNGGVAEDQREAKFRAHLAYSHIAPDDPVRNYGAPGTAHLHTFFGNPRVNAYSTFASLRNRSNEAKDYGWQTNRASGGPYNGSGYWVPSLVATDPLSNGKAYVLKPLQILLYYTANPATDAYKMQRLPRGLRYVGGTNMDDPDDTEVKAEIAAANAQAGTSGRYSYAGNGFLGWQLLTPDFNTIIQTTDGLDYSPVLRKPDGSNPWGSASNNPGILKAFIAAPSGFDGQNLWSPGGYVHMRNLVRDNFLGGKTQPNGWYRLPELELSILHLHNGWENDIKFLRLSSDDMADTMRGSAGGNGNSFHTDWFGAWDDSVFGNAGGWQDACVSTLNGQLTRECNDGTFNRDNQRLDNSHMTIPEPHTLTTRFVEIPAAWKGPATLGARAA